LDGFNDVDTAQDALDAWINRFKTSQATQGQAVLIPGEPELLTHAQRIQNGIPLNAVVAEEIRNISKELNVSL
jgi:LDH2 family malate/lactate/ureidoglycolate dehydrogenase